MYEWGKWHKPSKFSYFGCLACCKGFCYVYAQTSNRQEDYAGYKIYTKLLTVNLSYFWVAYAGRGMVRHLGNYQDAIEDANEAIALNPESYNGYYSRGYVNQGLGKFKADQGDITEAEKLYQAAINDCAEAINLKPEKAKIYNTRGWAKYLLGQLETEQGNAAAAQNLYQEAISDANEALHLQPKSAKFRSDTYHTRGTAKAALGVTRQRLKILMNPSDSIQRRHPLCDRAKAKDKHSISTKRL